MRIDNFGVSLRAGLSAKSFAREGFRLLCRKYSVSQKDTAPIPNAVYGKKEVLFSKEIPTSKSQIPIHTTS